MDSNEKNSNVRNQESSVPTPTHVYEPPVVDPKVERKKFLDKLLLLKSKADEYALEFWEDCKDRKKESAPGCYKDKNYTKGEG